MVEVWTLGGLVTTARGQDVWARGQGLVARRVTLWATARPLMADERQIRSRMVGSGDRKGEEEKEVREEDVIGAEQEK